MLAVRYKKAGLPGKWSVSPIVLIVAPACLAV